MKKPDLPKISLDTLVTRTQSQISTDIEDEAVILNTEDGVYYGLNPVGARIWNLIQGTRTVKEIRDIIVNEYEVEPERCERELLQLLGELATKGLIALKNEQAS